MKQALKILSAIAVIVVIASGTVEAQEYKTGVGLRLGTETSGFTIKHFIQDSRALEGIVGFWPWGLNLVLLYEVHRKAFEPQGLYWYYGGGGHLRFFPGSRYRCHPVWGCHGDRPSAFGFGIDGVVGIEYKIPDVPITVGGDVKPYIEVFTNGRVFGGLDPGIAFRFVF